MSRFCDLYARAKILLHLWPTMAKESSEGEFLETKVLITTGKGLKIYPRQTLSRKRYVNVHARAKLLLHL